MASHIERPLTKMNLSVGFSDNDLVSGLKEIFQHFGYDLAALSVEAKQDIADRLSKVAGRSDPWGWRYVHNFMVGNLQAGQEFKGAIVRLAAMIDGSPSQLVQGHSVIIHALGKVRPGALVYGDSRECANVQCPAHFIPRVWNQRYCSRECKTIMKGRLNGKYS